MRRARSHPDTHRHAFIETRGGSWFCAGLGCDQIRTSQPLNEELRDPPPERPSFDPDVDDDQPQPPAADAPRPELFDEVVDLPEPPPAEESPELPEDERSVSDLDAARALRDVGIADSEETAGPEWVDLFDDWFHAWLVGHREAFLSSDLWKAGAPPTSQRKALGGRIRVAARRGWIKKTGESLPSYLSHASHKETWVSTIYEEGS